MHRRDPTHVTFMVKKAEVCALRRLSPIENEHENQEYADEKPEILTADEAVILRWWNEETETQTNVWQKWAILLCFGIVDAIVD